jgi:hypothetical protein
METLLIKVPDKKSALVKQLLKELGVTIDDATSEVKSNKINVPNALTAKTIEEAHKGIGLSEPIKNVSDFVKSL